MTMDRKIVEALHDSGLRTVVVLTGGGSRFLSELMSVPGASRTVVGAHIPYSSDPLDRFVLETVKESVSKRTARRMADRAFSEAVRNSGAGTHCVGIACSAGLTTDRDRRGEDEAWCCLRSAGSDEFAHIEFEKDGATRDRQEDTLAALLLFMTSNASGVAGIEWVGDSGYSVRFQTETLTSPLSDFFRGVSRWVIVHSDGRIEPEGKPAPNLLSGSFNPMHMGHRKLADAAAELTGERVDFELSISNADKPEIDPATIRDRLRSIGAQRRIVLTRSPIFFGKADLFPETGFVIGFDTAVRILDPKYYGGEEGLLEALDALRKAPAHFLVGGRLTDQGFRTVQDLRIPEGFESMFKQIPESTFRCDVSSTGIRGE